MHALQIQWWLNKPLPMLLELVGEAPQTQGSFAEDALVTSAVQLIEKAEKFKGICVASKDTESNFAPAQKGKIVAKMQIIFPTPKDLETFIKESSP